MKGYELCLIFHPEVTEQDIDNLLNNLNEIIIRFKGQVLKTEKWGKKNLKFPIKKQIRGIFCFFCYMAESKVLREIDRVIRFNESILRYNTVRLPEGAAAGGDALAGAALLTQTSPVSPESTSGSPDTPGHEHDAAE